MKRRPVNEPGRKYGLLKPVRRERDPKTGKMKWLCECDCGGEHLVSTSCLTTGDVDNCGCLTKERRQKRAWKGCGELSGRYWAHVRSGASARSIELEVSIRRAWELFEAQGRKCALTGLPLKLAANKHDWAEQTASLDRKDSSRGYVEGNVQWVHKDINKMKNDLPQELFVELCRKVTMHQNGTEIQQ